MEGKFWVFTINNWEAEDITKLKSINFKYLIIGKEIGENGTPHIQGYVEFGGNWKLDRLKKNASSKAHWEKRKGTAEEASVYCKKDGDFEEIGEISKKKQGQRTDIQDVKNLVSQGKGMKDIVQEVTSYQAVRYAETLLKYVEVKRTWKPEVKWYWGPTGVGKTRRAMEEANNPWVSAKNLKWFEGYDAHEDVIFDDFRADFCTFHELLRLLDRYEIRVEVKGSSRQFLAKRIWITSCYPPNKVYQTREDIAQLERRIDFISEMRSEMEVAGNTNGDISETL